MLDDRIYIRMNSSEKRTFREIAKRKIQDGNTVVRSMVRKYIKSYFIDEIQSVTLPVEKAFCDEQWVKDHGIPQNIDIEVVFHEEYISYLRSDNKWNETVEIGSDKWEDIFENYPELFEYALNM